MHPTELRRLLARFLTAKQAANRSPATVQWYERQITGFILWLEGIPVADEDLAALIDRYMALERKRGMKPGSVAARFRALSAWLNWCARRRLLERSPILELDKPAVPKQQARYVTVEECGRLLASIGEADWTDARDRLIVTVLFFCGVRASELTGLYVSDVDTRGGTLMVRHGKGQKARIVPCPPDMAERTVSYLYSRPPYRGPELFLSSDGTGGIRGPLTTEGLRQVLIRRCRLAGLPYLHPHAWRHGFAMWTLNAGVALSGVSALMGHSSTHVTESVYAHWQLGALQRDYNEALSRMKQDE